VTAALRIPPGSAVSELAARAAMAASAPVAARRSGRAWKAVATALRDTATGRIAAEERAWAALIEAHRRELPELIAAAGTAERDPAERLAEATRAAEWMSLPPVWGRFLMRLVRELAPASCLELGTGFGLSAAYQAAALDLNGEGRLISLDQAALTDIARPGLERLGLGGRVELVSGLIEETLERALEEAAPIDYALLDADHTEEGTLTAFDTILPRLREGAVVVLDDVNWTDGMRRAWWSVERRDGVATVGLRRVGLAVLSRPAAAV
jgi:predicted O-methyltransferase YrrM